MRLGPYEILESLGKGSFGEVFLARTTTEAGFEKRVAVKRLLEAVVDEPQLVERFAIEARICGLLDHPNIVQVYNFLRESFGHLLVMEYLEGRNLRDIIRIFRRHNRLIPAGLAIDLIIQVCEGLHFAHTATGPDGGGLGLIHRDIKPENIMITVDGQVKIMDFGIARADFARTQTGIRSVKGTIEYMAPEQAHASHLEPAVDQFAAALILAEMLLGRRVYKAPTEAALYFQVGTAAVGPALEQIEKRYPSVFPILKSALALLPGDRFGDQAQMARALRVARRTFPERPSIEEFAADMSGNVSLPYRWGLLPPPSLARSGAGDEEWSRLRAVADEMARADGAAEQKSREDEGEGLAKDRPLLEAPEDHPALEAPADHPALEAPADHPALEAPEDHPALEAPADHPALEEVTLYETRPGDDSITRKQSYASSCPVPVGQDIPSPEVEQKYGGSPGEAKDTASSSGVVSASNSGVVSSDANSSRSIDAPPWEADERSRRRKRIAALGGLAILLVLAGGMWRLSGEASRGSDVGTGNATPSAPGITVTDASGDGDAGLPEPSSAKARPSAHPGGRRSETVPQEEKAPSIPAASRVKAGRTDGKPSGDAAQSKNLDGTRRPSAVPNSGDSTQSKNLDGTRGPSAVPISGDSAQSKNLDGTRGAFTVPISGDSAQSKNLDGTRGAFTVANSSVGRPEAPSPPGRLQFRVLPGDSSVAVDGRDIKDECWAGCVLEPGTHNLRLQHPDGRRASIELSIMSGVPRRCLYRFDHEPPLSCR